MIKKAESLRTWQLILMARILVSALFAGNRLKNYMAEKTARERGSLYTTVLHVEDFHTDGMKQLDTGWQTTDSDPKMIFEYNGSVVSVAMKMDRMVYTGDIIFYYTETSGRDYSAQKRIFLVPDKNNPGWYIASMPLTYMADIRIDPSVVAGNVLTFGEIVINSPKTMTDYFDITAYTVLMHMIYTAVISGILRFVQEFFTKKFE